MAKSTKCLGIVTESFVKPLPQWKEGTFRTQVNFFKMRREFATRTQATFRHLYLTMVRPHLGYAVQSSAPISKKPSILARDLNGSGAFQFGCPHFWILAPTTPFPIHNFPIARFVRWLIDWLSSALPSSGQDWIFSWLNALLSASVEIYRLLCNNSGFSRLFAKVHWRRILSQERRIINCGFEWIDIRRL